MFPTNPIAEASGGGMKIKFKVFQKFPEDANFKHIGFEQLNTDGNWEYMRNGRESLGYILGTISDNQGNATFLRHQYIGIDDVNGNEAYYKTFIRIISTGELKDIVWNKCAFGIKVSEHLFAPVYWHEDIEVIENSDFF